MSQSINEDDKLAALNSATMGTTMPVGTLPDGQRVQTGTVGAPIVNIKLYDELMNRPNIDSKRKADLEDTMAISLPVLKKAGVFNLFTPEKWILGSSPGRQFVSELALQNGHF